MLYVYTTECRLLGYKLGQTADGASTDNAAATRLKFSSEKQRSLAGTVLEQMDFIQECQGVVMSFESGAMYLAEGAAWKEVGEIGDGILTGAWAPN